MQCEISDQNGGSDVKNICKHCLFHCHVWLPKGNWSRMNHPKQTFVEKQSHLPGPKVTRLGTTKVWASQFHCEGEEMIGHNSRVHDAIWAHNKIIYIYIIHVYTYIGNSFKFPLIKHMYETIIQCQTNVQTRCKNLWPTASLTSEGQSWHSPLSSDVEYFTQVFWMDMSYVIMLWCLDILETWELEA